MDVGIIVLLLPLALVGVLAFAIWTFFEERKKTESMAATAAARGWRPTFRISACDPREHSPASWTP